MSDVQVQFISAPVKVQPKVRNIIELDHSIAIYVPSTINVNVPVDNSPWVDKASSTLSSWFGGVTITQGMGGWMSEQGFVSESVTIISSSCDSYQEHYEEFLDLAESIRDEMGQEMVSFMVDGKLRLI